MAEVISEVTKTSQLGHFASSLCWEDLPPEVIHYGKRALVDWSAAALAGASQPGARKVQKVLAALGQEGAATLVGTNIATSAPYAALGNAYASHLLDYDDVFNPIETTIHLSSCLWPAIMAIGQLRQLTGKEVLTAYVAGFETGARVARAAGPSHYQSAWHVTGTMGHVAAAAAAANALKLSVQETTHALGCSATQAAGIREVYGSDTKALHPAKAAMDGVLSALLAEAGFTSTDTAIEGQRGLLRAVSLDPNMALLTEGLNQHWHLPENGNKLYPTASLTHAAIEAATAAAADVSAERTITRIEIRMHPFSAAVTALAHPLTGSEARFSTPYCIAVALTRGGLGLGDFEQDTINDPIITRLCSLVNIQSDNQIDKRGCRLTLHWSDNTVSHYEVERNQGTASMPLSDEKLSGKLLDAIGHQLEPNQANALVEQCWTLEQISDINLIMKKLCGVSV
ncbi:MmgE/PrpD family protein [Paramixta manurensis]|uniref:MmgE/PrpD family protein n=1 Tax=Paramixta manurensis TaxID=2740817 RepID=A0A6M8UN26_9GAMM|nr:MmgE/PrpD family protein [Erwiniaceae bacterium PD-1]